MSIGKKKSRQSQQVNIDPSMDPAARGIVNMVTGAAAPFFQAPQSPHSGTAPPQFQPGMPSAVGRGVGPNLFGLNPSSDFGLPPGSFTTPQTRGFPGEAPPSFLGGTPGFDMRGGSPGEAPVSPVQSLLDGAFDTPEAFQGALGQLNQTFGGEFFGQDPGVTGFNNRMSGVEDAITSAAQRGVGDAFSLAGRTGSPAQGLTLGKTIARELAPFQFGAAENQMGRKSQAFQNERQRQLAAAAGAMSQFDPISQFQRFTAPLLEAAGLFPHSLSQRTEGRSTRSGFGLDLSGMLGL